jgi:putative Holliday junction resolvase
MGRLLGIDYGQKRVGLALSDPAKIICSPHGTIQRKDDEDVVRQVVALCAEKEVERIIVGLPLNMNGSNSESTDKAEAFAEKLRQAAPVPVEMWDERLSSVSAERLLIDAGTSRQKRKGMVDRIAAQIILQNYMESKEDSFPMG